MMLNKGLAFATVVTTVAAALGINCRGSGLCSGDSGLLGSALGQARGLDPNQQFTDGQHVVCIEATTTIGNPSLCVFYQNTGRTWTAAQSVDFLQKLVDHGCKICGSVPTDEGNDVSKGQLTANMVTNARRSLAVSWKQERRAQVQAEEVVDKRAEVAMPRSDFKKESPKALLARALGINCRGSSTCAVGGIGGSPRASLQGVHDAVAGGPDGQWKNGEQIACVGHVAGRVCAFYQDIGDRSFNKDQTVAYLDTLLDHGCKVCGSVPTDEGNDVSKGQLTVNYVA